MTPKEITQHLTFKCRNISTARFKMVSETKVSVYARHYL